MVWVVEVWVVGCVAGRKVGGEWDVRRSVVEMVVGMMGVGVVVAIVGGSQRVWWRVVRHISNH